MIHPTSSAALADSVRRCRRLGVPLTRYQLVASVSHQALWLAERTPKANSVIVRVRAPGKSRGTLTPSLSHRMGEGDRRPGEGSGVDVAEERGEGAFESSPKPARIRCPSGYELLNSYRCSTSRFGIGQLAGSNRTPIGLHRIAQKIGGGWPTGTVFKSRRPVGFTWQGQPEATITSRILWLEGLDPGWNQGGNVDSHARYIYIHGTGDELTIGSPASCGCIHLSCEDLLPLFDLVPVGSLVWIRP